MSSALALALDMEIAAAWREMHVWRKRITRRFSPAFDPNVVSAFQQYKADQYESALRALIRVKRRARAEDRRASAIDSGHGRVLLSDTNTEGCE